jgi:hypothetical protein
LSHSNLSARDPRLPLIIPKALRDIAPPALCSKPRYDKAPIECGGVCGTVYRIKFGTTLDQAAASTALDLVQMKRVLGVQEVNLLDLGGNRCRDMRIDIFYDERSK